MMSNFPQPPSNFHEFSLPYFTIEAKKPLYRLSLAQSSSGERYTSSLYFDRSGSGRFDGSDQSYGILYTGMTVECAFIESFGRTFEGTVAVQALRQRNLFKIICKRDLTLADLTGPNLAQLGLDGRISTCGRDEYKYCRIWAEKIWKHTDDVDGIRYKSRHDDNLYSVGLFGDRVTDLLQEDNLGNLMDDNPDLLGPILQRYEYALLS